MEHSHGKKELIEILIGLLNEVKPINSRSWNENQIEAINGMGLLTAKPIVYLLNVSEEDYMQRKFPGYVVPDSLPAILLFQVTLAWQARTAGRAL